MLFARIILIAGWAFQQWQGMMNARQQKLFERLKNVLDEISKSPETSTQVTSLFEDFVLSFEEIAVDLKKTSDEETAAILKAIVHSTTPTQ